MFKYKKILYWSEEDNAWLVEVPELPGCMADGTSEEEAIKNADVIIQEWIATAKDDGRDIPIPKKVY